MHKIVNSGFGENWIDLPVFTIQGLSDRTHIPRSHMPICKFMVFIPNDLYGREEISSVAYFSLVLAIVASQLFSSCS